MPGFALEGVEDFQWLPSSQPEFSFLCCVTRDEVILVALASRVFKKVVHVEIHECAASLGQSLPLSALLGSPSAVPISVFKFNRANLLSSILSHCESIISSGPFVFENFRFVPRA